MKSSPSHPPIGIALIGCGRISDSHLIAIAAQPEALRLVAVVDPDLAKAQAVARAYGAPHAFTTLEEALALGEVEAVCICTPNDLHAEQSIAALAAGRHVLVEKPMAESVEDARAMAKAAEASGRVLAIGMTFRHSPPIRHVQANRHTWGRLRAIDVSQCVLWDGPQAPWWATRTPQEGLILSLFAPHPLDFVQLMMEGADPVHIQAMCARHQTGWLAEDEAVIGLAYPGGRLANVHISYNQEFLVDRRVLYFEHMTARIEDSEFLWLNDDLVISPEVVPEPLHLMGARDLTGYFYNQMHEFVRAMHGETSGCVLHDEGLRLTALTQQIIATAVRVAT